MERLTEGWKRRPPLYGPIAAEASLVWPDCSIELHPVAGIYLDVTVVVDPSHLESEDPVRFDYPLHDSGGLEFRMPVVDILDCLENFTDCLKVFLLISVLGLKP